MTLGNRIKEIRNQAGLSQEAFGEKIGVTRQTVSKWELDQVIFFLHQRIMYHHLKQAIPRHTKI